MSLLGLLVLTLSVPQVARASDRVETQPYQGHVANDCGEGLFQKSRTEVCFEVTSGDRIVDLVIRDDLGVPTGALLHFNDENNELIRPAEHRICGSRTLDLPPDAAKIVIHIGADNSLDRYAWDQCRTATEVHYWGTTGTIEATFKNAS